MIDLDAIRARNDSAKARHSDDCEYCHANLIAFVDVDALLAEVELMREQAAMSELEASARKTADERFKKLRNDFMRSVREARIDGWRDPT